MNVLALNWLDRENPQAGGAEVHFFEIFARLAARGHRVVLIASGWRGCDRRAELDGIEVRRVGGRHSFALKARRAARSALAEERFDIVVEDINKLPLFLCGVTDLPVYVIVPHLFGTTAFREASLPIATAVWLAERPIPRAYRGAAFQAISQSTRDDLVARGVAPESIRVIYPGVDTNAFRPDPGVSRPDQPTFLYLGRLKRYKGVHLAIEAVAVARDRGHRLALQLAGQGDDRKRLERLVERLQVRDRVEFLGFVSEERKIDLMRRAWAVVFPSPKEGWGISNVEAAACGTPAVASASPGLRESVRHEDTGLLVPHGDVHSLTEALLRLSDEPQLVARLGAGARDFAARFSWETAAAQTEAHLLETRARYCSRKELV